MSTRDLAMQRLSQAFHGGKCLHAKTDAERQSLRRLVRKGLVCSPSRGLFVRAEDWRSLNSRARALMIIRSMSAMHPDWVFCDVSAAVVHGLAVSFHLLGQVHIAVPKSRHGRSTAKVIRHSTGSCPVVQVGGIKVTSLPRTVLDCLCGRSFAEGLVIADSALRMSGATATSFEGTLRRLGRGLHGIRHALSTLSHADPRSESGGESLARALMIEFGFRLPELQVTVRSTLGDGHFYRPDFMWRLPSGIVYGEFDGREKYVDPAMTHGASAASVMADERLRESRLSATGRIMRFCYADLRSPARLARLLDGFGIPRDRRPVSLDLRPNSRRGRPTTRQSTRRAAITA